MKSIRILCLLPLVLTLSLTIDAQTRSRKTVKPTPAPIAQEIRSSAAYAEVLFRRAELEADLEELLVSYKEEFPKVKEIRYELGMLNRELGRITSVKPSEANKLTLALGKLMVRKATLSLEYWSFKSRLNDIHPNVKKARRKLAIFEKAIKEIL